MPKENQINPEELSLEDQLKLLELEERKQALESKKLNDELVRLQLDDKRKEVETRRNNKERGKKDAELAIAAQRAMQARCNHHTGGHGAEAILQGQGDEKRPTCIGAMVFLDDTIRLRCDRCRAECLSTDPDRQKWAHWVGLWKSSINSKMMIIGGPKIQKVAQPAA